MSKKIKVGLIFGGRSAEHEVSIVSAESIYKAIDKRKFSVIPIGITKRGEWIIGRVFKDLKEGKIKNSRVVFPSIDLTKKGLLSFKKKIKIKKIDVFFPILHGPYGEDGTIQGLLELSGIPYVGSGVLGSALGMDKVLQKQIFRYLSIPTPNFLYFRSNNWQKQPKRVLLEVSKKIGFPCFVKPANLGSSVGISKVKKPSVLRKAINLAFRYDFKVIVEESIEGAREIEISLLGNEEPEVSVPGEIITKREFYDYEAKYIDPRSQTISNPKLNQQVVKKIKHFAKKAFVSLNCFGMARADFLVKKSNVYLNEINTIPGFTSISMYPKLWQASGLSYQKLIEKLIKLAFQRNKEEKKLLTSYHPKKDWYR